MIFPLTPHFQLIFPYFPHFSLIFPWFPSPLGRRGEPTSCSRQRRRNSVSETTPRTSRSFLRTPRLAGFSGCPQQRLEESPSELGMCAYLCAFICIYQYIISLSLSLPLFSRGVCLSNLRLWLRNKGGFTDSPVCIYINTHRIHTWLRINIYTHVQNSKCRWRIIRSHSWWKPSPCDPHMCKSGCHQNAPLGTAAGLNTIKYWFISLGSMIGWYLRNLNWHPNSILSQFLGFHFKVRGVTTKLGKIQDLKTSKCPFVLL